MTTTKRLFISLGTLSPVREGERVCKMENNCIYVFESLQNDVIDGSVDDSGCHSCLEQRSHVRAEQAEAVGA